jgi:hypothetical protein
MPKPSLWQLVLSLLIVGVIVSAVFVRVFDANRVALEAPIARPPSKQAAARPPALEFKERIVVPDSHTENPRDFRADMRDMPSLRLEAPADAKRPRFGKAQNATGKGRNDPAPPTQPAPDTGNVPAYGKATYNKPQTLQIGMSTEISVIIQVDDDQNISDRMTYLPGALTSAMIPVTRVMSARLSGNNDVNVTPQSTSEQIVSSRAPTQWRWHVKPTVAGTTILTLEIFGHYRYEEKLHPVAVRVYRDEITTTATWFEQARQYITSFEPIRATVFAIGGLIGTAALWLYRRYRKEPTQSG